jgi:hypothetical protein
MRLRLLPARRCLWTGDWQPSSATASSGLPVYFAATGNCTVAGNIVTCLPREAARSKPSLVSPPNIKRALSAWRWQGCPFRSCRPWVGAARAVQQVSERWNPRVKTGSSALTTVSGFIPSRMHPRARMICGCSSPRPLNVEPNLSLRPFQEIHVVGAGCTVTWFGG